MTEGNIDAMTLRDMLERGERVTVVGVRKGEDHAEWSIPDPETLVLPGHTSEPVAFDGDPICAPLSEVQESVRVLREAEDAFVGEITTHVSPTPSNFERIVELNRAGEAPEGDPTELEAGANRCAAG